VFCLKFLTFLKLVGVFYALYCCLACFVKAPVYRVCSQWYDMLLLHVKSGLCCSVLKLKSRSSRLNVFRLKLAS